MLDLWLPGDLEEPLKYALNKLALMVPRPTRTIWRQPKVLTLNLKKVTLDIMPSDFTRNSPLQLIGRRLTISPTAGRINVAVEITDIVDRSAIRLVVLTVVERLWCDTRTKHDCRQLLCMTNVVTHYSTGYYGGTVGNASRLFGSFLHRIVKVRRPYVLCAVRSAVTTCLA